LINNDSNILSNDLFCLNIYGLLFILSLLLLLLNKLQNGLLLF